VSRYAATPLIVALSPGHSDITRFRPWSTITTVNHLDRAEKIPTLLRRLNRWRFQYAFRHFGTLFAESFRMCESSWMMDPTRSRVMPSCSAIDLAEIRRSSKINSWNCSIISGVVTVLGRPGRGTSQVEKSPHLNWASSFWRWHTMVHVPLMFLVSVRKAWISFGALPCRKKRKTCWQLASRCCWNRARRLTCFLSASVTRKDLQFGTWTDPSFQRHYWFRPTTWGSMSG